MTFVIASDEMSFFGLLQSRIHEVWARFFSSTLEDRLNYSLSDSFQTMPWPASNFGAAANFRFEEYQTFRAAIMAARSEGLTKTYNRFHNPIEDSPDIIRLRELHQELDLCVLLAYGWGDLADRAAAEFLTEDNEPEHRYQDRLFWPAPFRDEVLARLLALNGERAADERARGVLPPECADADAELVPT